MRPEAKSELRWAGVDLHVHTPASKDYRGSRDSSEYIRLIQQANEFGSGKTQRRDQSRGKRGRNPIGCVAFTDHNSVDGFLNFRNLQAETETLSKAIRVRDPENALTRHLDRDLELLRSVRVLLGVEMKADPGIHLIVIFEESVDPRVVVSFLENTYATAYEEINGNPAPTAPCTLKQALDKVEQSFSDKAVVIFPHVDSSGGVYEDLKEFPGARISALTHPAVRALGFNRHETRERLLALFQQPDYRRTHPLAMIQGSDFHGEAGSLIGEPRTEVLVREGKATFKNLRESLREPGRVKCSVDLVSEEYAELTKGKPVSRYVSYPGKLGFKEADYDAVSEDICGMLNSDGGIVELEGSPADLAEGQTPWGAVRDQLSPLLRGRLDPPFEPFLFRSFQFSPGKIRVLARIPKRSKLYAANSRVLTREGGKPRVATPLEIEQIVSKNMNSRFGNRFKYGLEGASEDSILLSKLPRGITLILAAERKLDLSLPKSFSVIPLDPATERGAGIGELVDDIIDSQPEEFPFGNPEGDTSLVRGIDRARERDHYLRFTVPRASVAEESLATVSWGRVDQPTIAFYAAGYVGLLEPGSVVSQTRAVLLQPSEEWQEHVYSLLSWFKSSFFVWYCAVRLGMPSPFVELQRRPYRLPVPRLDDSDFLREIGEQAKGVISAEGDFMHEINRLRKKGSLDMEHVHKLRHRHNLAGNRSCLAIDRAIYKFLGFEDNDARFVAETLRQIKLTDFGLLDEQQPVEHD